MKKSKPRVPYLDVYRGTISNENCDAIIAQIRNFYCDYESFISLEDKKQLLTILKKIEEHQKCVPCVEKDNMYKVLDKMKEKYFCMER